LLALNNKPVIEIKKTQFYMGHVLNGMVPGTVIVMCKATHDAVMVGKKTPGRIVGLGLPTEEDDDSEETKEPQPARSISPR
jgi:hypothetical protein